MIIVGYGYLGSRIAEKYATKTRVTGWVRSETEVARCQSLGINVCQLDLDTKLLLDISLAGGAIYYFAPPPRQGKVDTRMTNFLDACDQYGLPKRIVYLSTTGVYGDCQGAWVDEQHAVNPTVDRAWRRWDAEQQLRQWSQHSDVDVVILRVAGIYGPGKLPLERIKKQLPLVRSDEAPYTNRIHIDDLVQVCSAAMERGINGEIYHASDGHPSTMLDYFNQIADLACLPRPPQITLAEAEKKLTPGMMSYMRESRRIENKKMLNELGVVLRYPTLQQGLAACVDLGEGIV